MSDGLIAVVTGANRGIGLEVSRQLASRGYQVIMTGRNREKDQVSSEHNPRRQARRTGCR